MSDQQPLQRPLRVKSKYKWMEGKEFPVDDQGTKKLLRDCTEDERQFIVDSGYDNIFAREQPRNRRYRVEVNDGPGTMRHAQRDRAWPESLRSAGEIDEQTRENTDNEKLPGFTAHPS
jgi:hypothetical protein